MAFEPQLVPLAGFAALMTAAAIEDLRRLVIPNRLILGLFILWPIHLGTVPGTTPATAAEAVGCATAVFSVGALLFSCGLIGGGDVKLLSAATLWAGAAASPPLLVLTGLIGGLLSLFFLTPWGARLITTRQVAANGAGPAAGMVSRVPVPYGAAIAAAALIVTIPPQSG